MWSHCAGTENTADVGSRGEHASALKRNSLWWEGPSWLKKSRSDWPVSRVIAQEHNADCLTELKKTSQEKKTTSVLTVSERKDVKNCIDPTRYSSIQRLFRVTALVIRFVNNLKIKIGSIQGVELQGEVSEEEMLGAEIRWLNSVQEELKTQRNYEQIEREFGLFADEDGVLRCKGRIANSSLPFKAKFPAIVTKDNHITELLVRRARERVHHCKTSATLAELRTKYWVIKGRQVVKKLSYQRLD